MLFFDESFINIDISYRILFVLYGIVIFDFVFHFLFHILLPSHARFSLFYTVFSIFYLYIWDALLLSFSVAKNLEA